MSVDFDYISTNILSLSEVEELEKYTKVQYPEFDLPDETDKTYVNLCKLNEYRLMELGELTGLCDFQLEGYLAKKPLPWEDMVSVINVYLQNSKVPKYSGFFLDIGCEQKGAKQTKRGYDSVSIRLEKGKCYLYYSGGDRLSTDSVYAKTVFTEYINVLDLPVAVEEGEGYFKLKGLQGEIRLTGSKLFGKDPSGFACQIPETEPAAIVGKLKKAFELMSSGKVFECSWRIFPANLRESEFENNQFALLDLIRQHRWPAISFDVDLKLESISMSDLEGLRKGFGESDEIFVPMLSTHIKDQVQGNFRDQIYGDFGIRTIQEGHRITLSLSATETPDEIAQEVGQALKLEFVSE
ncbi:MAG: hypothetical protein JAY90_06225 [Candidatus Thiodiazotropha lotti]|nr:hypothetical protein [Candidatus Thiodiazotropha lotti]